jgi:hypothetical protein
MNHWRKLLPDGAFMDVNYEDIVDNKQQVTRDLADYCQLSWSEQLSNSQDNQRAVHTASVLQARQPIYNTSVNRWKNYQHHLKPLLGALGELAPKI